MTRLQAFDTSNELSDADLRFVAAGDKAVQGPAKPRQPTVIFYRINLQDITITG